MISRKAKDDLHDVEDNTTFLLSGHEPSGETESVVPWLTSWSAVLVLFLFLSPYPLWIFVAL
jgi:hypothetical protein